MYTYMDFLAKFNDTFCEFMQDLVGAFPSDPDFRMYHMAISAAMMLDKRCVIDVFKESVVALYEKNILDKDESFFLKNDYQEYADYASSAAIIQKIKNCWTQLGNDDREIIWKYFHVLVKLSKRI